MQPGEQNRVRNEGSPEQEGVVGVEKPVVHEPTGRAITWSLFLRPSQAKRDYYCRVTLVLYRRRAPTKKTEVSVVLRRAFDKAVRRKPPGFAADAGGYAY
jgi:hypothetical protein